VGRRASRHRRQPFGEAGAMGFFLGLFRLAEAKPLPKRGHQTICSKSYSKPISE